MHKNYIPSSEKAVCMWGWYWNVKNKGYKRKVICSELGHHVIDSFAMYRIREQIELVKQSKTKLALEIPSENLRAYLQEDDSLFVKYYRGYYTILVEKKACNFGETDPLLSYIY